MFRELAKQAHEKFIAENEQAHQEDKRRVAKESIDETMAMLKDFGADLDHATFDEVSGIVEIDGVRFQGRYMLGKCPHCGQEELSSSIWSLERIGQLLTNFEVDNGHYWECPERPDRNEDQAKAESVSKRLADALQSFLNTYSEAPF